MTQTQSAAGAPATARFPQILGQGKPQTIVMFGTSLTEGGAWVKMVSDELNAAYPGLPTIINSGGSGQTSRWGVQRMQEKVLAHRPDVVFIEFAVNDSTARFELTLEESRRNVETIIAAIHEQNPACEIILQVMNPVIDRPEGHAGWRPNLPGYQQVYRDVAAQHGFLLIDHMPAWQAVLDQGEPAYRKLVPDGLHPNPAGYRTCVMPTLRTVLGLPLPK